MIVHADSQGRVTVHVWRGAEHVGFVRLTGMDGVAFQPHAQADITEDRIRGVLTKMAAFGDITDEYRLATHSPLHD